MPAPTLPPNFPHPPPAPTPADDKNKITITDHTWETGPDGNCAFVYREGAFTWTCAVPKENHALTDDTGDLPGVK